MEQYISKSAIVAEIERRVEAIRKAFNEPGILSGVDRTYANAQYDAFKSLFPFLDTLEVKEVNFEKEFDNYANGIMACDVQFEPFTHLYKCAKHFYELGMAARNKAQKGK